MAAYRHLKMPAPDVDVMPNLSAKKAEKTYVVKVTAPKCEQCKEALVGGYVVLGGVNLHEGCVDPYREAQAPKCPQCGKAVMGSYYPYTSDQTSSGKDEQATRLP